MGGDCFFNILGEYWSCNGITLVDLTSLYTCKNVHQIASPQNINQVTSLFTTVLGSSTQNHEFF